MYINLYTYVYIYVCIYIVRVCVCVPTYQVKWHHDTQHNYIKHHNKNATLSKMVLSTTTLYTYSGYHL